MTQKIKNTHGDATAVAVRTNLPVLIASFWATDNAKTFSMALMNSTETDIKLHLDAAKCLMPYQHSKPGIAGKKADQSAIEQKR